MSRTRTKVAAATIAVVTGAAGTAAAIAATHGTSQRSGTATTTTAATSSKPPRGPGGPRRGGFDASLTAAASYLGITKAELQTQLKAGKTLAKIASGTSGKSTAGLIAALVSAETTRLDAQVKAGKLTGAQEAKMLTGLRQRITDMVNGKRPSGPPPGGGVPPVAPNA